MTFCKINSTKSHQFWAWRVFSRSSQCPNIHFTPCLRPLFDVQSHWQWYSINVKYLTSCWALTDFPWWLVKLSLAYLGPSNALPSFIDWSQVSLGRLHKCAKSEYVKWIRMEGIFDFHCIKGALSKQIHIFFQQNENYDLCAKFGDLQSLGRGNKLWGGANLYIQVFQVKISHFLSEVIMCWQFLAQVWIVRMCLSSTMFLVMLCYVFGYAKGITWGQMKRKKWPKKQTSLLPAKTG